MKPKLPNRDVFQSKHDLCVPANNFLTYADLKSCIAGIRRGG